MYSQYRRYPKRLYVVPSGLSGGLDPPSAACPQPVHTDERDALRDELNGWTNEYMATHGGLHLHEGHPDLKAWLNDLLPRMIGLTQRPKLLRCSAEARKKARAWTGTLRVMYGKVRGTGKGAKLKQIVTTSGGGRANNVVIPKGGVTIRTMNLRNYHIRSFGKWAPEFYASGGKVVTPKPAPKGSTVIGVPFDPSVGGAGGDPTKSGANRITALTRAAIDAGITPPPGGGGAPAAGASPSFETLTSGEIFGVPTQYLVYGGLALVAYRMLKGR